ncbi:peptidase, partial [Lactobacillus sp. XV13L]|nr:peptidase [Lactobacillus sp. XV13L]
GTIDIPDVGTLYRVSDHEFVKSEDVNLQHGVPQKGVVWAGKNGAVTYHYQHGTYEAINSNLAANSAWQYNYTDNANGKTWYQVATNIWINSDDVATPKYTNPAGWYPIHNSQITQQQKPGYDLYNGVEGIKVYKVRQFFGLSNAHTIYDGNVISRVRNWQASHGLKATGIVDYNTWTHMGFSGKDWYDLDSYVAPLRTNINSSRSDHIEAMIAQAKEYLGKPWISGAASSPAYGVDCSGLVTQALYASGIDPQPTSNIQHAQPGNEWNCQLLYSSPYVHSVAYSQRLRGDLIFYQSPYDGSIWHVGIYLGNDQVLDSWPDSVAVRPITNWQRNIVAKVGRVFY